MVSLSSVSSAGGNLYLEIRRIELRGHRADARYRVSGIVGDGCDEALVRIDLDESSHVEIIPIYNEDGIGGTLDDRVGMGELTRLIFEALTQVYFCIEPSQRRNGFGRVTGYADGGRLYSLHEKVVMPHSVHMVTEAGPRWRAA